MCKDDEMDCMKVTLTWFCSVYLGSIRGHFEILIPLKEVTKMCVTIYCIGNTN